MTADLGPVACAAALATLPRMTPRRLSMILRRWEPEEAWQMVTSPSPIPWLAQLCERGDGVPQDWSAARTRDLPDRVWSDCMATGTRVLLLGEPGYPEILAIDGQAPAVLFCRGDLTAVDRRRVGIIGTRNASQAGRGLARRFGRELADEGVAVVSGLARGIDGSAHRGVLDTAGAPPVAVVASGPDVPFPREHAELWQRVVDHGLLLSEHSPGAPPLAEWFPLRNRILAALSEVMVVIESRVRGGSMLTVRESMTRNSTVMAVPGALGNPAAAGTNRLLADGATAVLDTSDIFVALGLDTRRAALPFDPRPMPTAEERLVLEAFAGETLSLEEVISRTRLDLLRAAVTVGRLESAGWLRSSGGWFEPVDVRELVR